MADIYVMKVKDDAGKIYDIYFYEGIYDGVFSDKGGTIPHTDYPKVSWDGVPWTEGAFLPINNLWCYDSKNEHCIANGYTFYNKRVFRPVANNSDIIEAWVTFDGENPYIFNLKANFKSIAGTQNYIEDDITFNQGSATISRNGALLLVRDREGRHGIFPARGAFAKPTDLFVNSISVVPGEEWGVAGITVKQTTSLQSTAPVLVIPDDILINKTKQDPFEPGGDSGTGGGDGDFDNTSTPIQIPELPSVSAASTGFISLFNPTLAQLNELASYMWSDLFDVGGWKKIFADPMDAILGLSILPVPIPSTGTKEVKVGNISTGISLSVASTQFVKVDCGSINVNEYWGAYLDYEPYTQAQIFLPYIGTRPISVDEIMGKTIQVVYHVDILTGACCCFIKCGDSVLYTYNGQCSIPIPITGANYTSVVNGVISVAASVGSLVATGGASAPTAVPAIASSAVNQMKPQIEKSGSISGSAGVLNMQTPYLILIRPRQALPSKQNEFMGYPSLITVQLTELSGYTEVQSIHLENIPATQEELTEIESLLKGGVIF